PGHGRSPDLESRANGVDRRPVGDHDAAIGWRGMAAPGPPAGRGGRPPTKPEPRAVALQPARRSTARDGRGSPHDRREWGRRAGAGPVPRWPRPAEDRLAERPRL